MNDSNPKPAIGILLRTHVRSEKAATQIQENWYFNVQIKASKVQTLAVIQSKYKFGL